VIQMCGNPVEIHTGTCLLAVHGTSLTTLTLTPVQWLPLNPAGSLVTVTFL